MFVDPEDPSLREILNALQALPEVRLCAYDEQENVRVSDGRTCCLVTLTLNECDAGELVMQFRSMFPEAGEYYVGGAAASTLDVQKPVAEEIPLVMLISVGIASSALTTVAGLLALLFMSFTIGFDIGLVLSKGILISMLGVFLLMPAVTLLLEKPPPPLPLKSAKLIGRGSIETYTESENS